MEDFLDVNCGWFTPLGGGTYLKRNVSDAPFERQASHYSL